MEKIFCSNCKHLDVPDDCNHPNNLQDNWREPGGYRDKEAENLNRNNDCRWYEEK